MTDITLTVEEHRWLLNAYLDKRDHPDPYDSTILTKADRQLADGLASKGLVEIRELRSGTRYLDQTVDGYDWLRDHAGEDNCLPSRYNRFWRNILAGETAVNIPSAELWSDEYDELILLGILDDRRDCDDGYVYSGGDATATLTPHGAAMRDFADTLLSQ